LEESIEKKLDMFEKTGQKQELGIGVVGIGFNQEPLSVLFEIERKLEELENKGGRYRDIRKKIGYRIPVMSRNTIIIDRLKAHQGEAYPIVYPEASLARVIEAFGGRENLTRYFDEIPQGYRLKKEYADRLSYQTIDLTAKEDLENKKDRLDLLTFHEVLMYLPGDIEILSEMCRYFHRLLASDGVVSMSVTSNGYSQNKQNVWHDFFEAGPYFYQKKGSKISREVVFPALEQSVTGIVAPVLGRAEAREEDVVAAFGMLQARRLIDPSIQVSEIESMELNLDHRIPIELTITDQTKELQHVKLVGFEIDEGRISGVTYQAEGMTWSELMDVDRIESLRIDEGNLEVVETTAQVSELVLPQLFEGRKIIDQAYGKGRGLFALRFPHEAEGQPQILLDMALTHRNLRSQENLKRLLQILDFIAKNRINPQGGPGSHYVRRTEDAYLRASRALQEMLSHILSKRGVQRGTQGLVEFIEAQRDPDIDHNFHSSQWADYCRALLWDKLIAENPSFASYDFGIPRPEARADRPEAREDESDKESSTVIDMKIDQVVTNEFEQQWQETFEKRIHRR